MSILILPKEKGGKKNEKVFLKILVEKENRTFFCWENENR